MKQNVEDQTVGEDARTLEGVEALEASRAVREHLWSGVPRKGEAHAG